MNRDPEQAVEFESLRLLFAGGLTLLLISWPLIGSFFGNTLVLILGAGAISFTILVVSIPVAQKGIWRTSYRGVVDCGNANGGLCGCSLVGDGASVRSISAILGKIHMVFLIGAVGCRGV